MISSKKVCQAGFTLLELIVVMTILGMVASLVIPHIGSGQVTLLKAQVREAVAVLNYARRSAIVEGQRKVARFYEGNQDDKSSQPKVPGQWISRGATLQWGETNQDKPQSADQDKPQSAEQTYQITFYPEGGSSGGELILSYLEYKAIIRINPLTGKIESEILDEKNS